MRLKILYLLHKEGQMCPCDLSDVLSMTVPAVSQHLKKMKDGGIVKYRKVAQTIFYSLSDQQDKVIAPLLYMVVATAETTKDEKDNKS